jgi:bacillithiol biosynthesis deacetylase BshB1
VKLDVLAIGAHRDDIEITCGGTVIKFVDLGYNVGILDLTQGEMGTRGSAREREKESKCAAKIMGLKVRENLKLPDSAVEITTENKLKLAKVIRKYQPHLVILPYWEQRHPDHAKCSQMGYEACYLSGLAKLKIPGEPHRPYKIIYTTSFFEIKHSFIVDITEQFGRKIKAVACYKSQFEDMEKKEVYPPARNIFDFMEIKARHYGYLIRKKYGEAFLVKENIEIEDPNKMLVPSI